MNKKIGIALLALFYVAVLLTLTSTPSVSDAFVLGVAAVGCLSLATIVLILNWPAGKKEKKDFDPGPIPVKSLKGKKNKHLKLSPGQRCCGDIEVVCRKCGHQGMDGKQTVIGDLLLMEATCPQCGHSGFVDEHIKEWEIV